MTETYSLDLDEEILSHLPDPASWVVINGEGVTSELIEDEFVTEVFNWQKQHIRKHGKPATASVLNDEFELVLEEPMTAIGDLLDRLRERYARNKQREVMKEIVQLQHDDPITVHQALIRKGRELSVLLSKRGEMFGTGDFDRAYHRYEQKLKQGPGASFGHKMLDDYFYGMRGLTFLLAPPKRYKALALDTPIATPDGWTTMLELSIGDQVFDERGYPCNVVAKSEIYLNRPCYRVRFSDGVSIVADADHLWQTKTRKPENHVGVWTTEEIRHTLNRVDHGHNHSVQVASPLQCESVPVPIDPYVLGVWLGDGTAADAAITTADLEILEIIREKGYTVTKWPSAQYTYGITGGLRKQLREAKLLKNKHIPVIYLRASYDQRLALLRGLMDADGHCAGQDGRCVLITTDPILRDGYVELVRSLGLKVTAKEYRAKIGQKDCGPCWHVRFTAYDTQPVFCLARKVQKQKRYSTEHSRSRTRQIVAVEPIESVPVQCITVDSPNHLYLAGEGMVPTHNSWGMIKSQVMNAQQGKCAYLYCLELPAEETDMRLRCLLAEVPWWHYVHNCITIREWQRIKEVSDEIDSMGIYKIVKPPHGQRGMDEMVYRARDGGADVVLIDQLQFVENRDGHSLGSMNQTGEYWGVIDRARELSDTGPIMIAHQFNRNTMYATEMPPIEMAKGSSAIEEFATTAIGQWADKDMIKSGTVEIGTLIARNHMYASWHMDVQLKQGCSFEVICRADVDDEDSD